MIVEPTSWVWADGRLVAWDQAMVHVVNPTVQYGWGVLEGVRVYPAEGGPAVFRVREHVRRLIDTCRAYHLRIAHDEDELIEAIIQVVAANELDACYVRPFVRLAGAEMSLNPHGQRTSVSVAAWRSDPRLGTRLREEGARVTLSSSERNGSKLLPGAVKVSGQYFNFMHARADAVAAGYDDTLICTADGHVAEGPGMNAFLVREGALSTPGTGDGILAGITRDTVIEMARDRGWTLSERSIGRAELYLADEVFLSGTAAEVVPVVSIDGRPIGTGQPGPVTTALARAYGDVVHGRAMHERGWLRRVEPAATPPPTEQIAPGAPTDRVERAVLTYYQTVDRDPRGVIALFAEDAEYSRPGYPPMVGRVALTSFYTEERVIAAGRHHIGDVFCDDLRAAVRGRFKGLLRDGTEVDLTFADFFTFALDGDERLSIRARATFFADQMV